MSRCPARHRAGQGHRFGSQEDPNRLGRMIDVTLDGHVMTLEMQRADRRNALNGQLVDSLREAVEKAAAEDVRAIVLTGQGHVFSSGADLSDAAGVADELPDKAKALNFAIDKTPVPVIGDQRTRDRSWRHPVDDLRSAGRRAGGLFPVSRS